MVFLLTPCAADEQKPNNSSNAPVSTKKQVQTNKSTSSNASKPNDPSKAIPAKPIQRKRKNPSRREAEISALTSETSDQLHGRLIFVNTTPQRQWWIKTGGGYTTSRTYGRTRVQQTDVSSFNLDTEYRQMYKNTYRFVAAVANYRYRSPHSLNYFDKSGYHMLSAGYGKTVLPGIDCDVALAQITQHRGDVDRRITPVYTLSVRKPLTSSLTLDTDTHLVRPWAEDSLVDSRINLTYKLTQALSLRLTYVANNILGSALTKASGWDNSFRVSLVFGSN